jgi:hypothetical protein
MRTRLIALVLALFSATACERPVLVEANAQPVEDHVGCDSYDRVDRARLGRREADLRDRRVRADQVRRDLTFNGEPPSGFDQGRVLITNLRYAWSQGEALAAFRAKDGRWRLRYQMSKSDEEIERPMSAQAGRALDEVLARSCLYDEPIFMPSNVPLKNGGEIKCFDGVAMVIDIEVGDRRRFAYQECDTWGYTGEVRSILYQAAFRRPG